MKPKIIKEKELKKTLGHCGILKRLISYEDKEEVNIDLVDINKAAKHFHKNSKEFYFVVDGNGEIELDGDKFFIEKGDLIIIPPNVVHNTIPKKNLKILVIGIPPVKSEDNIFV